MEILKAIESLNAGLAERERLLALLGHDLKDRLGGEAVEVRAEGAKMPGIRFLLVRLPTLDGGGQPRQWHVRISDYQIHCFGPGRDFETLTEWVRDIKREVEKASVPVDGQVGELGAAIVGLGTAVVADSDTPVGPRSRPSGLAAERAAGIPDE